MALHLDKKPDRAPASPTPSADATCDFAPQDTDAGRDAAPGDATGEFVVPASDPGTGIYEVPHRRTGRGREQVRFAARFK